MRVYERVDFVFVLLLLSLKVHTDSPTQLNPLQTYRLRPSQVSIFFFFYQTSPKINNLSCFTFSNKKLPLWFLYVLQHRVDPSERSGGCDGFTWLTSFLRPVSPWPLAVLPLSSATGAACCVTPAGGPACPPAPLGQSSSGSPASGCDGGSSSALVC